MRAARATPFQDASRRGPRDLRLSRRLVQPASPAFSPRLSFTPRLRAAHDPRGLMSNQNLSTKAGQLQVRSLPHTSIVEGWAAYPLGYAILASLHTSMHTLIRRITALLKVVSLPGSGPR